MVESFFVKQWSSAPILVCEEHALNLGCTGNPDQPRENVFPLQEGF